ncbi:MAG: DUF2218 domain-containing protein [Pseudomonadota bacterium]
MISRSRFETPNAARYLDKLCTHFGSKVKVQIDGDAGWVQFPFGCCEITANADHLEFCASASDAKDLATVAQVVTSHLERYAFRENPSLNWQTTPD